MSKFIKTIDLWCCNTVNAINNGSLILQVGQWVSCGGGAKSRYIGVKNGVFNVVHYPNATNANFRKRVFVAKLQKLVDQNVITNLEYTKFYRAKIWN